MDPERALEVLLEAGERAHGLSAHEEAARHFGAALPFIRNGLRPERLADVLERLGESWDAVGETAAAVAVWTEAMDERKGGDALGAARLCRRLGLAARNRGDAESARRHLETGVAVLADLPPCEELVDLHHARLLVDSPLFDPERATDTVTALIEVARTLSSPRAAVESLSAEGQLALGRCDYGLAQARAEEGLRIAEESGDWLLMQRSRRDLVWVSWAMADLDAFHRQIEAQLELDRLLGTRAQEPLSRFQFAVTAHLDGRWDEVVPLAEEAIAQARRYGQGRVLSMAHGTLSWFFTDRGDLDLAAQHLAEARQTVDMQGRDRALHFVRMAEAALALERGDAVERAGGRCRPAAPSRTGASRYGAGPGG